MNFIAFAIENPVKVTVAVFLLVLFGGLAYLSTPVQLTPDVVEPEITVTTLWPGASAQEVEREIIEEQEEQLKSVEGLEEFNSESADSSGSITLKFPVGTSLSDARARVSEKLNQVPEYPDDANEPVISTVNANTNAVAWFILKPLPPTHEDLRNLIGLYPELAAPLAPILNRPGRIDLTRINDLVDDHPVLETFVLGRNNPALMKKFAEDFIEAEFERVPGIANANVFGGRDQEFRIVVNPTRLAALGVTIDALRTVLLSQNRNTSAGDIQEGKQRNVVRTLGQFQSAVQVEETIITHRDSSPIRVRDVATVGISYKKPTGVVRQQGLSALAVNAQQSPGTNLKAIMGPARQKLDLDGDGTITSFELAECERIYGRCLRTAVEGLNQGVLKQKGVYLEQVYDETLYLDSATDLVRSNVYIGGTLAILVLLVFLRSLRSVLIVGLAIPISVVGTCLFVKAFDRSINVISLAGMAFAVGMVVDNAIVVLENIYRHYQMGKPPRRAALEGTQEVWGAVLASTLTTLAVFVPVIFVQGQAGQLFRDIAIAISCAVALSLLVSVTVIPTAAARLLSRRRSSDEPRTADRSVAGDSTPLHSQADTKSGFGIRGLFGLVRLGSWLNHGFADGMKWLLSMRGSTVIRLAIVLAFVAGSLVLSRKLLPDTEYLPGGNRNLIIAILLPPPGYNVDQMISLGENIEKQLAPYWLGKKGDDAPEIESFFFVASGRSLFMGARSVDELRSAELIPILSQAAAAQPGVIPIVSQASLFDSALSGGRTIDIEITGPDLEVLVLEAQKAFGICMQEFPMTAGNQLRPIPGLDLSSPELHVVPRLEKASELGISSSSIGYAVNALVDGAFAGDYWHEGRRIDLVLYGDDDYADQSQDLENLPISTPGGDNVLLSTVADVILSRGPEQVNHVERLRSITIQLKPAGGIALEAALRTVEEKIRGPLMQSPNFQSGLYQIRLAGTADKLADTWYELKWNLVLAVVLTYLLMSALFESFLYPLVIMTSVALALVGGLIGLTVLNRFSFQTLDMLTMLGFVILIGTVVNNAILIVHQSLNLIRGEGMTSNDAVCESVRTRIRPIFMSTLTTVLGMLPLVVPVPSLVEGHLVWISGAGSELYRGLGSVVLGGLIVSTAFTLILVPAGFSLVMDAQAEFVRLTASIRNPFRKRRAV
ncbi:MAG: efflux RND transporter permease subunit [Fuerstiella sp.]|jgi:HAE1 family hydrophobic/amphiphilic exporter-1|nr:efflux RND transporter permease subunit [Fuerstiella sp.]